MCKMMVVVSVSEKESWLVVVQCTMSLERRGWKEGHSKKRDCDCERPKHCSQESQHKQTTGYTRSLHSERKRWNLAQKYRERSVQHEKPPAPSLRSQLRSPRNVLCSIPMPGS